MAKKTVTDILRQRSARMRWAITILFVILIALQAGVFALVIRFLWGESVEAWLPELLISSAFLFAGAVLTLIVSTWQQRKTCRQINRAASRDLRALNMARNQANALKALAAA
jgi:hypothetical protein